MMLKELFVVALGGAAGSITRFLVSQKITSTLGDLFPFGILLVNVSGSFLIGLLSILLINKMNINPLYGLAIFIGFLGGYTTFSSFSMDTIILLQTGAYVKALVYIASSLILSLLATWLGMLLAKVVY